MVAPQWGSFQKPNEQNQQENPYQQQNSSVASESGKKWGEFKTPSTYTGPDVYANESIPGTIGRNIASNVARGAEAYVGRHGNIQKFGEAIIDKLPGSAGLLGSAINSFVGPEKWHNMVYGRNPEMTGAMKLPTSEDFKKITEGLTGEYTKPKNKPEKALQELSSDIGALGRPTSLVNNFGIPAAANVTKQISDWMGFGEDKSQIAKGLSWLAMSLMHGVNGMNFASGRMNEGRQGMPNNVNINVVRLENRLDQLERSMPHGDEAARVARQQIEGIRQDLQNGQVSVRDQMTRYDAINRSKRSGDLFNLNRTDRNLARRNIDEVRNAVVDEIHHSGANHPQALQAWNEGRTAWAVIHESNTMTNWIRDTLSGPYSKLLHAPVAGLFAGTAYGAKVAPWIAGSSAAIIPAGYKTIQTAIRSWNDPNLARYYWNSINAARLQNQDVFIKNYLEFNKRYEKKYGKSPIQQPKKKEVASAKKQNK